MKKKYLYVVNDSAEIGKRLRRMRIARNMTQKEVSESISASLACVGHWERGRNLPTRDNLLSLSELYGVTISEILTGERCGNEEELLERIRIYSPEERVDRPQRFTVRVVDERPADKVAKKELNPPGPLVGFLLGFFMHMAFDFICKIISNAP